MAIVCWISYSWLFVSQRSSTKTVQFLIVLSQSLNPLGKLCHIYKHCSVPKCLPSVTKVKKVFFFFKDLVSKCRKGRWYYRYILFFKFIINHCISKFHVCFFRSTLQRFGVVQIPIQPHSNVSLSCADFSTFYF